MDRKIETIILVTFLLASGLSVGLLSGPQMSLSSENSDIFSQAMTIQSRSQSGTGLIIENESHLENLAETEGWAGDGTQEKPFVIEEIEFDTEGMISISNTTSHVILRDYNVTNMDYGISIENSSNIRIKDCTVDSNRVGIYLNNVARFSVNDSDICNNEKGIVATRSREGIFFSNELKDNSQGGILGKGMKRCEIGNNTISNNGKDGIHITRFNLDPGLFVSQENNTIQYNVINNNQDDGIELYHPTLTMVKGNKVYDNADSGIITESISYELMVEQNNLYGNKRGLSFRYSLLDSRVVDNRIHDNSREGVYTAGQSTDTSFEGNVISKNEDGMKLRGGHFEIRDNTIKNNDGIGIHLGSGTSHCTVAGNDFEGNSRAYLDEGEDNSFKNNEVSSWARFKMFFYNNITTLILLMMITATTIAGYLYWRWRKAEEKEEYEESLDDFD